jgi:hypothetical protein
MIEQTTELPDTTRLARHASIIGRRIAPNVVGHASACVGL